MDRVILSYLVAFEWHFGWSLDLFIISAMASALTLAAALMLKRNNNIKVIYVLGKASSDPWQAPWKSKGSSLQKVYF